MQRKIIVCGAAPFFAEERGVMTPLRPLPITMNVIKRFFCAGSWLISARSNDSSKREQMYRASSIVFRPGANFSYASCLK
jgi:hypothetical protein